MFRMKRFRMKTTTLPILGGFILCWIFFTMVLLHIFDEASVRHLFSLDVDPSAGAEILSYGSDSDWEREASKFRKPSPEVVNLVLAKYSDRREKFSFYKGAASPEDQRLLNESDFFDYPRNFPRLRKFFVDVDVNATSLPRENAFASFRHPEGYYDYNNHYIIWQDQETKFSKREKLGRGHYCETFLADDIVRGVTVVLKSLKPVRVPKVKRELTILEKVRHLPHVIRLLSPVRGRRGDLAFAFEFEPHHQDRYDSMTIDEIRIFTKQLLTALEGVHSLGIMHRDVKPSNMRYDFQRMRMVLVDFGLAEYYLPGAKYSLSVSTTNYKAPELLLGHDQYDYASDLWSVGCVLAGQVFKVKTLFMGRIKPQVVSSIGEILGRKGMEEYTRKYNLSIRASQSQVVRKAHEAMALVKRETSVDWNSFLDDGQRASGSKEDVDDAIDLISKLLVYDHYKRLTAREALKHPFLTKSSRGARWFV